MAAPRKSEATSSRAKRMSSGRSLAGLYLLLQGLACYAWWGLLWADPLRFGPKFFRLRALEQFVEDVVLADVAMYGGISVLAGLLAMMGLRGHRAVACIALGGVAYATLVTVGMWRHERATDLALAMMLASLIATVLSIVTLLGPRR